MPANDLRKRLERLRAHSTPHVRPAPVAAPPPAAAAAGTRPPASPYAPGVAPLPAGPGLPGRPILAAQGRFQLIENHYGLDFAHGARRLVDVLGYDAATAAALARDQALGGIDLRSLAFIDTETTGLMGGSGTLVFLVGVGVWDGDGFVLRQYFLPDPNDEAALLTRLVSDLEPHAGWVSFNGRAFDLPLLEARLTINRQRGALGRRPHLDLLMPARRMYRGRLPSCSLGTLEQQVLNIVREQDDVPGALIPELYAGYLRTGDPRDMQRVIYHNAVDILSMVTLAAHLFEMFAPRTSAQRAPEDWLRLALWHEDNGRPAEAEAAFRQALAGRLRLGDRSLGLRRLAHLLRRHDRRGETVALWQQLASFTVDDPEPFIELAKHYEWHAPDLAQARAWAERAAAVVSAWPAGWERESALADLGHRLARLEKKLRARSPAEG